MTHDTLTIAGSDWKFINICLSKEAPDYHDLTLLILHHLEVKLNGGHYEPASQRDCALAGVIHKMLETYEGNLCQSTDTK